jgi:hypothetical protein
VEKSTVRTEVTIYMLLGPKQLEGPLLIPVTVFYVLVFLTGLAGNLSVALIKKKIKFSSYIRIRTGAVAKSYMRKGLLIYEEMHKYLVIFEEATPVCISLYMRKILFSFSSV